jgi:hypothetical protein
MAMAKVELSSTASSIPSIKVLSIFREQNGERQTALQGSMLFNTPRVQFYNQFLHVGCGCQKSRTENPCPPPSGKVLV